MKYLMPVLIALFVITLAACSPKVVCNDPYILVGTSCCLDANQNNICDTEERTPSPTPLITLPPLPTASQVPTPTPVTEINPVVLGAVGEPSSVGNLRLLMRNSTHYELRFAMQDLQGKYVAQTGSIQLNLVSEGQNIVYSETVPMVYADFVTEQIAGRQGVAFSYLIPTALVNKSPTSAGTAQLSVTVFGKVYRVQANVDNLPKFSVDELKAENDRLFKASAHFLANRISSGIYNITVIRAGHFSPLVPIGTSPSYYRIDLRVTANQSAVFDPSSILVTDVRGNQYERKFGGSLDGRHTLAASVPLEGHYYFEPIPLTQTPTKFSMYIAATPIELPLQ